MPYTLDTKIGQLLDDTHAERILEKHIPGISTNPLLGLLRGVTLKEIVDMPQAKEAGISEERVKNVLAEINSLKK